jgi:YfiH family protein
MIKAQILESSPRIHHAFFTRNGGVSSGLYSSLNCGFGSKDDPGDVAINRFRAINRLIKGGELLTLYQLHSSRVVIVEEPWLQNNAPKADAAVTKHTGLALGILTADCVPVLFADGKANSGSGIIGAAHAGWQGALGGIVEATVSAMLGLGAQISNLTAAIGPCIHKNSYEVGPEFLDRFLISDPSNKIYFTSSNRDGYFKFDIVSYVGNKLDTLGISFQTIGKDTYSDDVNFFSYRRATHLGEQDYGRCLSAIVIADR